MKVMKNVVNISVLKWVGWLFCLWEGGELYEIEFGLLDIVGRFNVVINGCDDDFDRDVVGYDIWDIVVGLLKFIF